MSEPIKNELLTLKNMLGKSCIKLIELYFRDIEYVDVLSIKLGEVKYLYNTKNIKFEEITKHFEKLGFTVVMDPDILLVEKIKLAAIELIHYAFNANSLIRNSDYISEKLQTPYEKISKVFSKITGVTLGNLRKFCKGVSEPIKNELLTLKNMLGKSCIKLIELYFRDIEYVDVLSIKLGEVKLSYNTKNIKFEEITKHFEKLGFTVVMDPDILLVEKIKLAAIELIHYAFNANSLIRNSDYISEKLQTPYEKISKVFSKITGVTLEKYLIMLKIEKAKELIANNEYTLSEISYMLGYSSVQYLSNQFKKITGVTVSEFKTDPNKYRRPIEDIL